MTGTVPSSVRGSPEAMAPFLLRILPLIIVGTALCSLANIVLTRNMSAAEYGAFSFFLSTISLMSLIGLLGFQQTLPHFLSLYTREGQPALAVGFVIAALALVILATAVTTVVGIYAVVPLIRNTASHQCLSDGYYLATAIALITLLSVYLTYHKHAMVSSSAGPDGPVYQLVLIGTVFLALLLPHSHTGLLAVEVVASMGIAAAACLVVELVWCVVKFGEAPGGAKPSFRLREWLVETLPVGGSAILGTLMYSADIIAVRLIVGSESAAAYAVASSLASFVIIPRTATGRYFSQEAPHIGETDRASVLQHLIGKTLRFNLAAAAAVGLGIALLSQPLLGLYGQEYQVAWPALFLLLLARLLEGPASVGIKLLNLEGYGKDLAMTNLMTGVLFVALLVGLVSLFGQNGAALSVIGFVLASNLMFYQSTVKYTGLRLMPFARAGLPAGS